MYHLELLGGAKEVQELKSTLFLMYRSLVDMVLTRLKVHFKKAEVVCITFVCSYFVFLFVFHRTPCFPRSSITIPLHKILFQMIKKGESSKQRLICLRIKQQIIFPVQGKIPIGIFRVQTQSLVSGKSFCDFFLQTQNRLKVIPIGIFLSKSKSAVPG